MEGAKTVRANVDHAVAAGVDTARKLDFDFTDAFAKAGLVRLVGALEVDLDAAGDIAEMVSEE